MAIAKTISLCKSNTRELQVKTALTAGTFSTVKDVITKYMTVTQEEIQNKQSVQNITNALHFRANNHQGRPRGHGRGNFQNFNRNTHRNNNSNYRQNSNNSNSNNYRNNSRGNYQNNNNYQNRRGNFNRNTNSRTYAYQGNCLTPPSETNANQNWRRADDVHNDN